MVKKILLGVLAVSLIAVIVVFRVPLQARVTKAFDLGPKLVVGSPREFTVNLIDPSMRRYLRVRMTFQYLASKELVKELEDRDAEIRHAIIEVLRSKKVSDLVSAEDTDKLRQQLLTSVNSVLSAGKVSEIFFVELVIQ